MKYLAILVSGLLFTCGLLGLILSVVKIIKAISSAIQMEGRPGFYMVEAIDAILVSIVIFILAGGVYKLFSGDQNVLKNSSIFSKITNFKELKVMLWEAILLTLTVWCGLGFYFNPESNINYEKLILPVTILLLALALKLINSKNHT